jgi:peptidyl-tRNA hydrolase, PTH1 family
LASIRRATPAREECRALVQELEGDLLVRPQTYMNRSGWAIRCLVDRHGIVPSDVLVVYDDVALEPGRLRLRRGGSSGGHRGMASVIENLRSEEIPRLRLGIGAPAQAEDEKALSDFVLASFSPEEHETVGLLVTRAAEAIAIWLAEGIDVAMRRCNG